MRCVTCETSAAPHELVEGKCLKCLHQELVILRLLMAHTIMAIEQCPGAPHPVEGPCYLPSFSVGFVEHLKTALNGVKRETALSSPVAPP
jgi:hypothetical protein